MLSSIFQSNQLNIIHHYHYFFQRPNQNSCRYSVFLNCSTIFKVEIIFQTVQLDKQIHEHIRIDACLVAEGNCFNKQVSGMWILFEFTTELESLGYDAVGCGLSVSKPWWSQKTTECYIIITYTVSRKVRLNWYHRLQQSISHCILTVTQW